MTPRKASLRVAHQTRCPNATKTALKSVGRRSGCTCSPSYYTFMRGTDGRPIKGAYVDEDGRIVTGDGRGGRIKNRRVADQVVTKLQAAIDESRVGIARPRTMTFHAWADEFERITDGRVKKGDLKPRTLEAYKETLAFARKAINDIPLRDIGARELRKFDDLFTGQRPASRLRHLRQLSACLTAAVDEGYLAINPVPVFTKKLNLRAPKRGKAPFDDAELERLWIAYREYEDVYGYSARFSAETGLRLGEIVALDWQNVDLTNGQVVVEHTWDDEAGLVAPKDREVRTVYLTPHARTVLEEWVGVVGVRTEGPVFPNPLTGGRLTARIAQRRLEDTMTDSLVPKQHPKLRLPRSFHSLRYTTSVLMQRRGYHPRLIEQTLGHGSLELSFGVYGGWTPDQLAAEAGRTPSQD